VIVGRERREAKPLGGPGVIQELPPGTVSYRVGTTQAASDSLQVRMFGRGGHGSMPEATVDPVVMAASTVMRLQTIVSREIGATDAAVLTVGVLQAGTKENVIPDEATIKLNVRTFDEDVRRKVRGAIERIANAESDASGAPKPRSPEDAGVLPEAARVHTDFRSSPCRMGPRSPRPLGRARIPQTGRILPNFREWV
jgi:amidohydrolase